MAGRHHERQDAPDPVDPVLQQAAGAAAVLVRRGAHRIDHLQAHPIDHQCHRLRQGLLEQLLHPAADDVRRPHHFGHLLLAAGPAVGDRLPDLRLVDGLDVTQLADPSGRHQPPHRHRRRRFQEVVSQIRVVKSYVTEASEQKQFNNHYDATVDATRQQSNHWHLMDTVRRVVLNVIFFGIYAIIFVRTAKGYFGVGDMILLIQLMTMARQPVQMMSYIIDVAQRAVAGSKDYFSVMETRPAHVPQTATTTIREPEPGVPMISFNDTVFSYDGTNRVIDHVTFDVSPGEKVALVGESGGGKSTLVNLLLGLYPVTEGAIMVAGNDISQVTPDALRRRIGVVFQDPALFSGSIRKNIAYGTEATDAQIRDAAHRAYADRFIKRFSQQYDTLVGERGIKLSGGQKQRISIARALLKDAPILVLDEATSALDTKSERWVQAGLESLMADRTSLIIAHRLSTISSVDRIVTLDAGRVDEIGTPAELAASGGIYAELLALQASSSKADRKRLERFGIKL